MLITNDDENYKYPPQTLKQLAAYYGMPVWIFRKWIALIDGQIGKRNGHYYNSKQVKIILEHYGTPVLAIFTFFGTAADALAQNIKSGKPQINSRDGVEDMLISATASASFNYIGIFGMLLLSVVTMPVASYVLVRQLIVRQRLKKGERGYNNAMIAVCILVIIVMSGLVVYSGYKFGMAIF